MNQYATIPCRSFTNLFCPRFVRCHFIYLTIEECPLGKASKMSRLSTTFLAMLSFATGLCPHGAHAQDLSASDVLKKAAETYRQASSFSIVAEKRVDLDTDTSGERYVAPTGIEVGPSHKSDDIQITLMGLGSSKAKLLLKGGKKQIVVVDDGKLVWTLMPAQHEYTEATAMSAIQLPVHIIRIGNNEISGVDLLLRYEILVAARFQSISSYESWAKLEHSETLKVGKDKKECYVVAIQMPRGAQKQKLWVDKKEFTIWKSVDTTLGPSGDPGVTLQTTVTVTTEQMTLNPSLDEGNFIFTPPDQAKKVDSLKLSGDNPF
jgi:Predicted periplasmic protein (DUF2092)